MKEQNVILVTLGYVITNLLGGIDIALQTLLLFMSIDYITGLVVAGVFKKSRKNKSGALDSSIGFKGIIKKCMMLLMVLIAHHLYLVIGWEFIRYGVIIAFLTNEVISITENACLMGVPIPPTLRNAIGILQKKGDENENNTKK